MASVFLSYDHEDEQHAAPIISALEKAGHEVWWDRQIHGGAQYNSEIENAVAAAAAVVVLWSKRSVQSAWVRDEAAEGRDSGKLVPLALDGTRPPMGFRQFQTIDLVKGKGSGRSAKLQELVRAVEKVAAGRVAAEPPAPRRKSPPARKGLAVAAALALVAAAGVGVWQLRPSTHAVPVVAVRAGDQTAAARSMARDLLVKLGSAQAGELSHVEIVDEGASKRPDLILEVSGGGAGQKSANLLLLRASDRQLLSSQDLAPSGAMTGDLESSIVIAANSAIGCATAALASRPAPSADLLKQYLGACERFSALYGMEDVSILIPQLEQIVQRQPRFLPGWSELLLAGAYVRSIPTDVAKPSPQWLRERIQEARAVDANMPEIGLAELELMPVTDFTRRIELVDSLREAQPDNKFVLGARAEQLMLVGRNNDAVVDAERTARLDPFAPYSRSEYIRTLAFSGRLSRAFEELGNFTPFPPVAMNLADTRFRVNMRYGDPKPALDILRMYGTSKAHEAFLIAKITPTPDNVNRALAVARAVAAQGGYFSTLTEVLATFGRDDEIYETLMRTPKQHVDQFTLQTLFRPALKNFRDNPRFLQIAQHFGLLDYWQDTGRWADFCSEPELPYDCKKEAAKLKA